MKCVIEVVATNMDSGHVAVHQETVDVDVHQSVKELFINQMTKSAHFEPKKVGPILITRSFITLL